MPTLVDERTLTELDHVRLTHLLQRHGDHGATANALRAVLADALVLPTARLPAHVVTMNSRVLLVDLTTRACSTLTLTYPADANAAVHKVSVLSPVGSSLLGLRVGDIARWSSPDGQTREAQVAVIEFQPEAHGDLTL